MKIRNLPQLRLSGLIAVGVLLGRGAHADTTLTFDSFPSGQANNTAVIAGFGSNASVSSAGVFVSGDGTPNITLTWGVTSVPGGGGGGGNNIEWDYYIDGVWQAVQLNNSATNNYFGTNAVPHSLTFSPVPGVAVQLNSFNFHGYYNSPETYDHTWTVRGGTNILATGTNSFTSDGTSSHPVNVNYTGATNQVLTLEILRTGGDGNPFNIAVDDISFAQIGAPASPAVTSVSPTDGQTDVPAYYAYAATIQDGATSVVTNAIQLRRNGNLVSPAPSIARAGATTTVNFQAPVLLPSGSSNRFTLTFSDNGAPAKSYTNEVSFIVETYDTRIYEWRFTQGDLTPDLGNGLLAFADGPTGSTSNLTTFGITDGSTVPHINGSPARYMHVPAFTMQDEGYNVELNAPGNGGGTNLNQYTMIFDLLVPFPLNWLAFANTEPGNFAGSDADFYMKPDGAVGLISYSATGVIQPDTWHRVAIAISPSHMTWYVDGVQVLDRSGTGVDFGPNSGGFDLHTTGPCLRLFNEYYNAFGEPPGYYTHELYLAAFAITDRTLGAAEVAALGGPAANGIQVLPPRLNVAKSGANVVVSWPTIYSGFPLKSTTNLAGGAWIPVSTGSSNTAVLPATGNRFFQLRQ